MTRMVLLSLLFLPSSSPALTQLAWLSFNFTINFQLLSLNINWESKCCRTQDMLWNFDNHPIFKIAFLRSRNFFSPERRSKVVKFAKNDPLDTLIVMARDEQFLFFPWKWFKGGTIGWFFSFSGCIKPYNFATFTLVYFLVFSHKDYLSS